MWGNGIRIARISGVDLRLDASWLLIATLIVWSLSTTYFPARLPDAGGLTLTIMAFIAMLGLFISLLVHEMAHAHVARYFGIDVPDITLFLFGGVARLRSEPLSARTEFLIAVVGPLASFGLAVAFWIGTGLSDFIALSPTVGSVLRYLAVINLALALFNLLPAFPMDGGRVLRAWLWARSGDFLAATRRAVATTRAIAFGLMALGLYGMFVGAIAAGMWIILIAVFLLATSRGGLAQLETEAAFDGRTVASLMTSNPWNARTDQTLSELVDKVFLDHAVTFAPVVENGELLGYVDTEIVRRIDRENWTTTTVEDVLEATDEENSISYDMPALDLMARIAQSGRRKFLVVDAHGLVGVVTLADVLAILNLAEALGYMPDKAYPATRWAQSHADGAS